LLRGLDLHNAADAEEAAKYTPEADAILQGREGLSWG
jgi:hypothetical protein